MSSNDKINLPIVSDNETTDKESTSVFSNDSIEDCILIERTIRDVIYEVTGNDNIDADMLLVGKDISIHPAFFIYIFDILEKKLKLPVFSIFRDFSYEVMTIRNLVTAFTKLGSIVY